MLARRRTESASWPSFETLAALAPQDEVLCLSGEGRKLKPHPEEPCHSASQTRVNALMAWRLEGWPQADHNPRIRGPSPLRRVSSVTAHTSASSRSGERPDERPVRAKSH